MVPAVKDYVKIAYKLKMRSLLLSVCFVHGPGGVCAGQQAHTLLFVMAYEQKNLAPASHQSAVPTRRLYRHLA